MTLEEQETTVTFNRAEKIVRIYTSIPHHIRKLSKDERVTIEREHTYQGKVEAIFASVPADQFNMLTFKRKSKPLTDERRAELSENMKRLRNAQLGKR